MTFLQKETKENWLKLDINTDVSNQIKPMLNSKIRGTTHFSKGRVPNKKWVKSISNNFLQISFLI